MLLCKGCNNMSDDIQYITSVLVARGTATVDDTGLIVAMGPARAEQTIKSGMELADLTNVTFICPKCKASGPLDVFEIVRVSYLSGLRATTEVKTPLGNVWVADDERELALRVFTKENAGWEQPY